MPIMEGLIVTLIGSLIVYLVKRHDELDKRIDLIEKHLIVIENALPKRRTDANYFSPNSGIEL